ncbi:MAG: hypothetical protein ACRDHW_00485 [Ktedonobacteraceae bacterium]
MVKTWKFAVSTPQGIYQGELLGEMEPGETNAQAMQAVSLIVRNYIQNYQPGVTILACFVTDGALHIDAPDATLIPLDIEQEFSV